MRLRLNAKKKAILAYGTGAGLGIVVPYVLSKYVDNKITVTSPWMKPSVIIPIVTGLAGILIPRYTKFIRNKNTKNLLLMYGITSIITGTMNGMKGAGYIPASASLGGCQSCAQKAYGIARHQGGTSILPNGPSRFAPDYTSSTYYPNFQGNFVMRPQSMARGYASDVSRNPKAAIPTTIPKNGNVIRA